LKFVDVQLIVINDQERMDLTNWINDQDWLDLTEWINEWISIPTYNIYLYELSLHSTLACPDLAARTCRRPYSLYTRRYHAWRIKFSYTS